MYRKLPLIPVLLAAGAACAQGTGKAPANAAQVEAIAFLISSWGRPIDNWEVRADGTARHATMVTDEGAPFTTYRLEHRAFTIAPEDFARLAAIATELPQPRLNREDCEHVVTDFPYGALELARDGASESIAFDTGCLDERYQAFVGQLQAMDEAVTALAREHPVTRVERFGDP